MTVEQFLQELQELLVDEVSSAELQDSLAYYRSYFHEEMAKGRSAEEIIHSLGSPRLIARSIVDAHGNQVHSGYQDETVEDYTDYDAETGRVYSQGEEPGRSLFDSEGFRYLKTMVIVVAVLLVLGILVRALLPVIVVIIVIGLISKLFRGDF